MTGDTCILICKVKTVLSSAGRYAPNNQTSKKTEQGRWKKTTKNKQTKQNKTKTKTGNNDRRLYHQQSFGIVQLWMHLQNLLFETVVSKKICDSISFSNWPWYVFINKNVNVKRYTPVILLRDVLVTNNCWNM